MNLTDHILNYIQHLGQSAYLESVFAAASMEQTLTQLADLLQSNNPEIINETCLFIRDAVLLTDEPFRAQFFPCIHASLVIPALESLLFSDDHPSRDHAIYTLGKIGAVQSASRLREAFHHYQASDPVVLDALLSEIHWLEGKQDWQLVETLLDSPHFLTRWSGLFLLRRFSDEDDQKRQLLRRLSHDEHPLIRAEAIYATYSFFCRSVKRHKPRHKWLRVKLKNAKPTLCFEEVAIRFQQHLARQARRHYQRDDLEAFVDTLL